MRIALLSAGDGWHVRDLHRAAAALGHEAAAVDFRRVVASVSTSAPGADAPRLDLSGFDAVLVRTMPPGSLEQVVFRMDLLHRLQASGVRVLNPPRAVEICVDKYLATALLEAAGLRVPPTIVCQHADAALEAFETLGGDVVVKPLFGSEGRGMVRVSDAEMAWRTFRTLERTQAVLYLQQFIRHPGWDLRVFVVGGRVLTAMRRRSRGDWRTNVAQGGSAEPFHLDPNQERLALRAAAALGALVAGVDLLSGPEGAWYVLEVNAVPGWRALAPATGVDVAAALVRYLTEEYAEDEAVFSRYLIGLHAQTACIWEATARKPGNVHRYCDFDDTTYVDFLVSAAAAAPLLAVSPDHSVGQTVFEAVNRTRFHVNPNTNLGILLLLAPLARAAAGRDLREELPRVLDAIDAEEAKLFFAAIRLANPGGLGRAPEQDVSAAPTLPLRQIMALAADRDLIARQYANDFREVFDDGAPAVMEGVERTGSMEGAIIHAHLHLMARHPDTLIARKRGVAEAEESARRARAVLDAGWPNGRAGWAALANLDAWLRAEGRGRNPGTTADLIAACLFVLLHEGRITLPLSIPWPAGFDHD